MTSDKLAHECQLLMDWIERRKAQRQGTGDLSARLNALRAKQIRCEMKEQKKREKAA